MTDSERIVSLKARLGHWRHLYRRQIEAAEILLKHKNILIEEASHLRFDLQKAKTELANHPNWKNGEVKPSAPGLYLTRYRTDRSHYDLMRWEGDNWAHPKINLHPTFSWTEIPGETYEDSNPF